MTDGPQVGGAARRSLCAKGETQREGGYALFFVLSLILLMSLLLAGVTRDSRGHAKAARRALEAAEARAESETALSLTIMHLLAAKPEDRWTADGSERLLKIGETEWRVTITPEDGKVDINQAQQPLLTELFTAAGVQADEAQTLADRVADWRDADDLTHVNGAERRAYESAGLPPPRSGPFLRPQELKRVMGMTDDLYACLEDAVTVYSGKAGIDRRFAPEILRAKAGKSETGAAVALPATSPLAFEPAAGKALTIRLMPSGAGHTTGGSAVIIRLTEHPGYPWWLLEKIPNVISERSGGQGCVSSVPRGIPKDGNLTPEG